jgi:hypothetical protein
MQEFTSFQTWVGSGKFNAKGSEIGYVVTFNDNGETYIASTQKGLKDSERFAALAVKFSEKRFSNQQDATNWAYAKAKELIRKL